MHPHRNDCPVSLDARLSELTDRQIRDLYFPNNARHFYCRKCFICQSHLVFLLSNDVLYFDSSCDCTRQYSQPKPMLWRALLSYEPPGD